MNEHKIVTQCSRCGFVTSRNLNPDIDFVKFISDELQNLDCYKCKEIKDGVINYTVNYSVYRGSNPIDTVKKAKKIEYKYRLINISENNNLDSSYAYYLKSVKIIVRLMQLHILPGILIFSLMKFAIGFALILIILISEVYLFFEFHRFEKNEANND